MRPLLSGLFLLAALLVLCEKSGHCGGFGDPFPGVASSYLVVVDGKPLWGHNVTLRRPPASITKIMTALVTLERSIPGDVVTVSRQAASETGSRIGLKAGDRLMASDLLAAALIHSANDACRALADHVAGDERRFVALMNDKAKALGLHDTRFANACGHDDPGLYSTSADLAVLAGHAMSKGAIADLVSTVSKTIRTVDGRRSFDIENKNELVGRYEGAIGVKSGTTAGAGKSLVALAERGGRRVMLVLLDAPDRWWSAVAILDRAFAEAESASPVRP